MTEDRQEELLIQMNVKLASIDAQMSTLSEILKNHETRIQKLETIPSKNGLKEDLVALLVKALVISVSATATLAGASGLIAKIFGK